MKYDTDNNDTTDYINITTDIYKPAWCCYFYNKQNNIVSSLKQCKRFFVISWGLVKGSLLHDNHIAMIYYVQWFYMRWNTSRVESKKSRNESKKSRVEGKKSRVEGKKSRVTEKVEGFSKSQGSIY